MRRREQRLAEAISHGAPGEPAPEALLSALRVEETRRKSLEAQLAALPESTAVVSVNRDYVTRELRTRADDVRGVLHRQGLQARETLQNLLVDRVDCTPVLVAGRARLRVHRRRHVRWAAGGQHLAHYLWWPQRDSNPCLQSATRKMF